MAFERLEQIFGKRLEKLWWHRETPLGDADGPLPLALPRQGPNLGDGDVASAENNDLFLFETAQVAREMGFGILDVDSEHGLILSQVGDQVNWI